MTCKGAAAIRAASKMAEQQQARMDKPSTAAAAASASSKPGVNQSAVAGARTTTTVVKDDKPASPSPPPAKKTKRSFCLLLFSRYVMLVAGVAYWLMDWLISVGPYLSGRNARPYTVFQRTPDNNCGKAEEQKQLADEASWLWLGCQRRDLLLWLSTTLWQSIVPQFGHCFVALGQLCKQPSPPFASHLIPYAWQPVTQDKKKKFGENCFG